MKIVFQLILHEATIHLYVKFPNHSPSFQLLFITLKKQLETPQIHSKKHLFKTNSQKRKKKKNIYIYIYLKLINYFYMRF